MPRSPIVPMDIPSALRHLRGVPGTMHALIQTHGPPVFQRTGNSFAALGRAIIYQQLSGKAAGTIYRRFLALYARKRFPRPDQVLATSVEHLRSAGLSRAKVSSLLDLAAKYVDGTIRPRKFSRMHENELIDLLTQVRGIGPWSVHMFMMLGLARSDVLPVGDLGVRKGVQLYFVLPDLPDARTMESLSEPWRPYRSVASWYMWRVSESGLPSSP